MAGEDEEDQQGHCAAKTGGCHFMCKVYLQLDFPQSILFLNEKTLRNRKRDIYVLSKMLKWLTGSSAKSYQVKYALWVEINNRLDINEEEMGAVLGQVINNKAIRGKFGSVHPDLRAQGVTRVEVGDQGIIFHKDLAPGKFSIFFLFIIYFVALKSSYQKETTLEL